MRGRMKSIPDSGQLSEDDLVGNAVKHTRVSASVSLDRLHQRPHVHDDIQRDQWDYTSSYELREQL